MPIIPCRHMQRHRLTMAISTIATLLSTGTVIAQEELEEVTVTGSRIQRDVGFESAVPVTALTQDELTMFEPGLGMSEQLENLPQFFAPFPTYQKKMPGS